MRAIRMPRQTGNPTSSRRKGIGKSFDQISRARHRLRPAPPHHEECRFRRHGRDLRRVDRPAHRHPPAPYRGRRRDDGLAWRGGGARSARQCRADARRHRPDRARHLDAEQHLPGDRRRDPEPARHAPRLRLRHAGGVLRLRLCGDDRRPLHPRRAGQAGAGDRLGDLLAHPRLDRPLDLRPVRRRRRRAGAGGGRGRPATSPTAASSRPACAPTAPTRTSFSSTADPRPPARSAISGWKAARCSSTPSA